MIPRAHRSGITLTVLLAVLVLFTAFALVSGEVYRATFKTLATSQDAQTRMVRVQGAIQALRSDVWNSTRIDAPSPQRISLDTPAGRVIWQIDPQGTLTRSVDPPSPSVPLQQWHNLAVTLQFARDPAGLRLTAQDALTRQPDNLLLQSQLLLSNGGRP